MEPDNSLSALVKEVQQLRAPLSVCPSAKENICINDVLAEIIEKSAYKNDYEEITGKLLFTYVPYNTVIDGIKKIVGWSIF